MSPGSPRPRPAGRFLASAVGLLVGIARAVAFWSAVVIPLVYVGGYLAVVLDPDLVLPSTEVLGALLAVNVLALVVGHGYRASARRGPTAVGAPDGGSTHPGAATQDDASQRAGPSQPAD